MPEAVKEQTVVAIYDSHADAESAVKALEKAGLDMKRLSIAGRGFHTEEHALGFYTSGDRIKHWGAAGKREGSWCWRTEPTQSSSTRARTVLGTTRTSLLATHAS